MIANILSDKSSPVNCSDIDCTSKVLSIVSDIVTVVVCLISVATLKTNLTDFQSSEQMKCFENSWGDKLSLIISTSIRIRGIKSCLENYIEQSRKIFKNLLTTSRLFTCLLSSTDKLLPPVTFSS